jgi:hypothetical protein
MPVSHIERLYLAISMCHRKHILSFSKIQSVNIVVALDFSLFYQKFAVRCSGSSISKKINGVHEGIVWYEINLPK